MCLSYMHAITRGVVGYRRDLEKVLCTSVRFLTAEAVPEKLNKWSEHQWISPPVQFVDGQDPPTALSWLRRRGRQMSQAIIFKLFREHKVRYYDGKKIRRVKHTRQLQLGDRLLLPLQVIQYKGSPTSSSVQTVASANRRGVIDSELDQWVEMSRGWLLYSCSDFFVINKPEGIAVQGGTRIRISIDRIYERLAVLKNWSEPPKLVHRLDKMTTGVMVVARSANAASWLGESFHQKGQKIESGAFAIEKVYLAVLDARRMSRTKGTIKSLIKVGESEMASETHFQLLSKKKGLALVKLRPKTGRKHQLRMHCAFKLNAPVLGDRMYTLSERRYTKEEIRAFEEEFGDGCLRHVYLHSHELMIYRSKKKPILMSAPLPEHMERIMQWIRQPERETD